MFDYIYSMVSWFKVMMNMSHEQRLQYKSAIYTIYYLVVHIITHIVPRKAARVNFSENSDKAAMLCWG